MTKNDQNGTFAQIPTRFQEDQNTVLTVWKHGICLKTRYFGHFASNPDLGMHLFASLCQNDQNDQNDQKQCPKQWFTNDQKRVSKTVVLIPYLGTGFRPDSTRFRCQKPIVLVNMSKTLFLSKTRVWKHCFWDKTLLSVGQTRVLGMTKTRVYWLVEYPGLCHLPVFARHCRVQKHQKNSKSLNTACLRILHVSEYWFS